MIRRFLRAASLPFWVALSSWYFVDRAAHGSAVDAWPTALIFCLVGLLLSLTVDRLGVFDTKGSERARNVDPKTIRLADLFLAVLAAVAATLALTPIEVFLRATPDDGWAMVVARCLVHPVFAFASVIGLGFGDRTAAASATESA